MRLSVPIIYACTRPGILFVFYNTLVWIAQTKQAVAKGRIEIVRRSHDEFTNPCETCLNCDRTPNAVCSSPNCKTCRCEDWATFIIDEKTRQGRCLTNDYFRFKLAKLSSFVVYSKGNFCLHPNRADPPYLSATDICASQNIENRWLWTKYNQLLNVGAMRCIQKADTFSYVNGDYYPDLALAHCDAANTNQRWSCDGSLFKHMGTGYYMNFGNAFSGRAILFHGKGVYSQWQRGANSRESLCSRVSSYDGCYRYIDGSAIFEIEDKAFDTCEGTTTLCEKSQFIEAPIEATHHHCRLAMKQTQFLNYSSWDLLPIDDNTFNVSLIDTILKLTVNLSSILTHNLRGQLIKLFLTCKSGEKSKINHVSSETHCLLVKIHSIFKDIAITPTTIPLTTTLISTTSISTSITTRNRTTNTTASSESNVGGNDSVVTAVVIVICLLVLCFVIGAVLAFLFKKRKKESLSRHTETTIDDVPSHRCPATSAQSDNVLYMGPSEQTAKNECELYEPGNESVYLYAEPPSNNNGDATSSEPQYHYASSDIINNTDKQALSRYETCYPQSEISA